MTTTMKAVRIHQYGGPEQLVLEQVAIPEINTDEVLIKVHAAGINPVDWKIREGYLEGMLNHSLPLTLGWDVAGEVFAKGADVNGLDVGNAVYSRPEIARNGGYAEYIAIKASEVALKPSALSWTEAAAVPLTALTAWQALYEIAGLKSGDNVLIHAGAGGVGHLAIQLAKLKGATVYTTASKGNHDFVSALGADEAIDYQNDDFTRLKNMDVIFDTMGGEVQEQSWQCIKAGGTMVSIASTPEAALATKYSATGVFCFVQPSRSQLTELAALFDAGKLKIEVAVVLPLAQVAEAHEKSQTAKTRGKLVLAVIE